mmetsp:Transcript_93225/g.263557  ORF Transcript_93225/g.263557 Transcript_93225/m.263557 type:complete len:201 (+) Transcript_93225:1034-1636(+)
MTHHAPRGHGCQAESRRPQTLCGSPRRSVAKPGVPRARQTAARPHWPARPCGSLCPCQRQSWSFGKTSAGLARAARCLACLAQGSPPGACTLGAFQTVCPNRQHGSGGPHHARATRGGWQLYPQGLSSEGVRHASPWQCSARRSRLRSSAESSCGSGSGCGTAAAPPPRARPAGASPSRSPAAPRSPPPASPPPGPAGRP